ncbi:pyridoxamine 5'-phosphate oxidase family protein [Roseibium aggregatum]|uniref:Pyridoxamine 5'-phosphate oxidase family protein n=1 Tax=Roseibium aggregatum TaxID=187304 RepID=A0A926S396_9HYPH|nr:pyridoxamine 5'-phosphate oxidase family protein [Roseibium aggregatum]MBD1545093.1 pyridoxamine 5'-phosphate oxidase family protein [Roseibium aggregatum]
MTDKITSIEALERIYGVPVAASIVKVADRVTPLYRQMIAASPFCALATAGPEGLDCSPRGDPGTCVYVDDEKTLLIPDRRGNNRIDSLRNIVRDPRVALMMLIPSSGSTLRINGEAELTVDPALLQRFAVKGKEPRCIIRITIRELYFQCARAVLRAGLWDQAAQINPASLPTPGQILADMTNGETGGEAYDREWPERAAKTMW